MTKRRQFVASFRGNHGRQSSIGRDSLRWLCDALQQRAQRLYFESETLWMHERGCSSPVIVRIQSDFAPVCAEAIKEVLSASVIQEEQQASKNVRGMNE